MNVEELHARITAVRAETAKALLGQEALIEDVLVAVLAGGHVLLEGVPGLGKTLLVRTLGKVLGVGFRRIQFTPDLMPSDVTGGNVFDQKEDRFVFHPGPVFTQLLLADEINRAPAKTQSSLLEAMQELGVTTDGTTRPLPSPFFVLATQNPVESQGTYPLPEAQLDRFLMKLFVRYPALEAERALLRQVADGFDAARLESAALTQVLAEDELATMRATVREVRVDDDVIAYVADLVTRTRAHRSIDLGASPRGSVGLLTAARARAACAGRGFVVPDDVKALAAAVLRHRVILHPDAELEGVTADECIEEILREAKVPRTVA